MSQFVVRKDIPLEQGTGYLRPKSPPTLVHFDSPAIAVMTDFKLVHPVTTKADVPIDRALERMKSAGVRLLLVVDDNDRIIGLITANDIQGEKPIRLTRDTGVPYSDLQVHAVMTKHDEITVLDLRSVRDSQVGHIVQTLKSLERHHILVIEVEKQSGRQRVRGLFSLSQIAKQLGRDLVEDELAAHSLAEMVQVKS